MPNNKVPDYCKDCVMLWTHGIKDGKHDRHCCHFGRPAPKIWKHCKEHGGKVPYAMREPSSIGNQINEILAQRKARRGADNHE